MAAFIKDCHFFVLPIAKTWGIQYAFNLDALQQEGKPIKKWWIYLYLF